MDNFNKGIESKLRINALEKSFMDTIDNFSNKNPDLTMNEVGAVMLTMLTQWNNKELRDAIK